MEKKKFPVYLPNPFEVSAYREYEITSLKDWLSAAIEAGATHVKFDGETQDYAVETIDVSALYFRDETYEEFQVRTDKENAEKLRYQKIDYYRKKSQYEELKRFFESEKENA